MWIAVVLQTEPPRLARQGRVVRTVSGHRNAVMSMDARGSFVVTGGNDRDLRVWDLEERATVPSSRVMASANRVTVQHGTRRPLRAVGCTSDELLVGIP